jgi:hypothetical protein
MKGRRMIERRISPVLTAFAILVLTTPIPALAQQRMILVPTCMGKMARIVVPDDPAEPERLQCCDKGCHAAGSRRKKAQPGGDCC